jgi:hypothetical protein
MTRFLVRISITITYFIKFYIYFASKFILFYFMAPFCFNTPVYRLIRMTSHHQITPVPRRLTLLRCIVLCLLYKFKLVPYSKRIITNNKI